jgi:hypothetical protein
MSFPKSRRFRSPTQVTPGPGQYDVATPLSLSAAIFTRGKRFQDCGGYRPLRLQLGGGPSAPGTAPIRKRDLLVACELKDNEIRALKSLVATLQEQLNASSASVCVGQRALYDTRTRYVDTLADLQRVTLQSDQFLGEVAHTCQRNVTLRCTLAN